MPHCHCTGYGGDCCAAPETYGTIENCKSAARTNQTVVSDLHGTLLRSRSPFSYFMLVAFEAGSPLRGLVLLLLWPVIWIIETLVSEAASLQLLIFISTVGITEAQLHGVARAVLCKFFLEDMHSLVYPTFMACGRRFVATSTPKVMVEPFLKDFLGVETVCGSELLMMRGVCSGLVKRDSYGVLGEKEKRDKLHSAVGGLTPDLGLGVDSTSSPFLSLCKEAYIVTMDPVQAVPREDYLKPLIFHDGRLAIRPTPLAALAIYLWFPFGLILAAARLLSWMFLPVEISAPIGAFLGVRVKVKGAPPLIQGNETRGMLYVCTHRTLMDPIFLAAALRRRVPAVTYSLSRLSEMISPIKVVKLTRKRDEDAKTIKDALTQGDLAICPEGTTCREPYLLRFSPLFAELTNDIVPTCMHVATSFFHGTTAGGFKAMDPLYFLMNPFPVYNLTFLEPLAKDETCASGKSSIWVANHLQKKMAQVLNYECTSLTRRDKYRVLAGNDGIVQSRGGASDPLRNINMEMGLKMPSLFRSRRNDHNRTGQQYRKQSMSLNDGYGSLSLGDDGLTILSSLHSSICSLFQDRAGS
ncbi:hypothetical protein KP509_02G073400 [Ceratopteris richardii]|uniref:Phospholipid/glycerol acyltransferase domain-containing protein n=1 Tax=Ceratopteris richardii TaxID=49495 RepID=A0A8T2V739_CERRI|nr:hypothetical protein KP509_02G073400 [Ceratopteris richardii]